ncbi:Fe(3+)-hydroxamate ABC transporter permease FhuB [Vibrio quintilis]|uniref:Iron(3+)-hydroxamate import system permease protein FhuB n=1 Tax=Vibrio quintilis TaxID=1117707 RepID=A0A1M7YV33_9VIBR|nr:Fe(3+)-hydroxamate ABC transporter permease FhuB [Vibrio quintilis]SHO56326.1 Iron(3+)-hydroxamate import system permease protein FhuB [Vibrio quintilis]
MQSVDQITKTVPGNRCFSLGYGLVCGLVVAILIWLSVGSDLSWQAQGSVILRLLRHLLSHTDDVSVSWNFAETLWLSSQLPRLCAAMIVGAILAFAGSVMQQLTQNSLVSPFTLGTASGSWLALVVISIFAPAWVNDWGHLAAWVGALMAVGLVVIIVGVDNLSGLPVVLAGMAVNILLGAVAVSLTLLNHQYAKHLFLWGAGDLAQNGWAEVLHLLTGLFPIGLLLVGAPRVLAMLRLGHQNAKARGVQLGFTLAGIILLCAGLIATAIADVGVISFIGLMAPNVARRLGARTPLQEMLASLLLGMIMLTGADALAIFLSQHSLNLIPTGIVAAFIGAPALIYVARQHRYAQDNVFFTPPAAIVRHVGRVSLALGVIFVVIVSGGFLFTQTTLSHEVHWVLQWPNAFEASLRWPRLLTAMVSGAGLAVAGVLLQRLIYNPLASPDILGLSAGATLALVTGSLCFGLNIFQSAPVLAFTGSVSVLLLLLMLSRRHRFAPSILVLNGFALTAMVDAMVQFVLAQGNEDTYAILNWLSGSTYRVTSTQALVVMIAVSGLIGIAMALSRWLTLLSAGRAFAAARGLAVNRAFVGLLVCVALLCSTVTMVMGPVAFVGLLAPHIAIMLGATSVRQQMAMAAVIGSILLMLADWLGQQLMYPFQLPAGTFVSIIGGLYFIALLLKSKRMV